MGNEIKLQSVDHIGIIVKNIDAAIEYWESQLGIGPWTKHDLSELGGILLAQATLGPVGFQLIEPVRESAVEYLGIKGEGLHHLCVLVDDVGVATQKLEAEGGKVIFSNVENQHMDNESWVEIAGPCSIVLELREYPT